jgi:putative transposase
MGDTATVVQAYRFALDPTPAQARRMAMFAGASRFAYNRMLAEVKSALTAREWERRLLGGAVTEPQGWSLAALRRTWNANKDTWAPWWRECSKEAFNHGLECLANALKNWADGKSGKRPPVGFPRFKKRAGRASFAYTTGSIHLLGDRRSVQLPRLGRVRTHENTRKVHRRVANGTARILRATVARDSSGRWHCSFTVEVRRTVERGTHRRHQAVGVDVGVVDLLVAADDRGREILRVPAPRSLGGAQARLRRLQRKAARQQRGSHRRAKTVKAIGRTHGRAANVRRDVIHKATTTLAKTADVVVVEDLHVAGMGRRKPGAGRGGRGMNRAVADAAMAEVRRQLTYKADWYGSRLVVADRWYPSSKICSGCGNRKPRLSLSERTYRCTQPACGLVIDRDLNAAVNLARWPEQAGVPSPGSGPADVNYGRRADRETDPAQAGDAGGRDPSTPHHPRVGQTGIAASQEVAA